MAAKPTLQPAPKPQKIPPVAPARREAFAILLEVERGQAYADDLLRNARVSALTSQDRHLCTTLVMGTLRWQIQLDATIRPLLAKPNARLDTEIRIALRLGAFQLLRLDRIPDHATISESVSLARLAGHKFAAGMVNAVLRKLASQPKPGLSEAANPSPAALAEATAHPLWLVERWIGNYGFDAAKAICEQGQQQPELTLRLDGKELEAELAADGIQLASGAILSEARRILTGDVTATEAFKAGRVRIQEEGSQLIAELCGDLKQLPKRILDCCAAPGGKTLILAELNPQAQITAYEISPARFEALKARVADSAYASKIDVVQADASELESADLYDVVLADVPCSGTGTMGRNPEIRHRLKPEDLARHHARQCAILHGALRVGTRRVVYSTCSLEPEENSAVVEEVLAQSPDWERVSVAAILCELRDEGCLQAGSAELLLKATAQDGSLTILPGSLGLEVQTDGFFLALLERRS